MKTFWIIMAAVGGLFAIYFVLQDDYEKAFVAAAAGAVCWLLNYRQKLRESMPKENEPKQDDEESDEEIRS